MNYSCRICDKVLISDTFIWYLGERFCGIKCFNSAGYDDEDIDYEEEFDCYCRDPEDCRCEP